jgi:hypothetical protein
MCFIVRNRSGKRLRHPKAKSPLKPKKGLNWASGHWQEKCHPRMGKRGLSDRLEVDMGRRDWIWATLGEGGLILAVAAIGWATREPLIFASLGPTAYELVEQPLARSARPYNVVVGHLIGLASGFFALYILKAWSAPEVLVTGGVSAERLWAVTIAATLTTILTLIARAGQPAAIATTLLVAMGAMQSRRGALAIVAGVVIITVIGEPARLLRLRYQARKQ